MTHTIRSEATDRRSRIARARVRARDEIRIAYLSAREARRIYGLETSALRPAFNPGDEIRDLEEIQ